MGRGTDSRLGLYRSYADAETSIGLSLSTEPGAMSATSTAPFYIVVTARIIKSLRPDEPITLISSSNPLGELVSKTFEDIVCTTDASKVMPIMVGEGKTDCWVVHLPVEDMGNHDFVTIPSMTSGDALVVKHELPRDKIEVARIEPGERYRTKMTRRMMGTLFWTSGDASVLDGKRVRRWDDSQTDLERKEVWECRLMPYEQGYDETFGDRPTIDGENPLTLLFVDTGGEVEFEVVS